MSTSFHPSKCTHTQQWVVNTHTAVHTQQWVVNTHTNTVNTHVGSHLFLWRAGICWGIGALLKGLTSIIVLRVEESTGHSLPPPTIPASTETRTRRPLGYNSDSQAIRSRLPPKKTLPFKKSIMLTKVAIVWNKWINKWTGLEYILKWNILLWWWSWIFFSITRIFRNNYNMLI